MALLDNVVQQGVGALGGQRLHDPVEGRLVECQIASHVEALPDHFGLDATGEQLLSQKRRGRTK